ncbi:hypothetical protein AB0904_09955 [Streptomyces sp. NPDC006684]|uniref:hypothetical protein n=1 Tax=Streptomyces sp. NPDC006684 TaxID=3154477 RepID=UPI003455F68D
MARIRQVQAEGRYAYAVERSRSCHRHESTGPGTLATASRAAETARTRAAEALLTQRLAHLREQDLPTSSPPAMERLSEASVCMQEGAA